MSSPWLRPVLVLDRQRLHPRLPRVGQHAVAVRRRPHSPGGSFPAPPDDSDGWHAAAGPARDDAARRRSEPPAVSSMASTPQAPSRHALAGFFSIWQLGLYRTLDPRGLFNLVAAVGSLLVSRHFTTAAATAPRLSAERSRHVASGDLLRHGGHQPGLRGLLDPHPPVSPGLQRLRLQPDAAGGLAGNRPWQPAGDSMGRSGGLPATGARLGRVGNRLVDSRTESCSSSSSTFSF